MHIISLVSIIIIFTSIPLMLILAQFRKIPVSMTLAVLNILLFGLHLIFFSSELINEDIMRLFWASSSPSENYLQIWDDLGFTPYYFTPSGFDSLKLQSIITSAYTHSGIGHVLSNMLMLIFLGIPLEEKIGWKKFSLIYGSAHIGAMLIVFGAALMVNLGGGLGIIGEFLGQGLHTTGIGASAAIFGILGAYLILYPNDKVMFPLLIIRRWPIKIIFLVYAGFETAAVVLGANDGIGHLAHLGGLLAGMVAAKVISNAFEQHEKMKKEETFDASGLKVLAKDISTKEAYNRLENEDDPEVRRAWIEELAKRGKCPKCGSKLKASKDKISCTNCKWTSNK